MEIVTFFDHLPLAGSPISPAAALSLPTPFDTRRADLERRYYPRLGTDLLVWLTGKNVSDDTAERLMAHVKNLSLGGVFIQLENPFPLRTRVHLGFRLPGSELVVETDGLVVWSKPSKGMGIEFLEVTVKEHDAIRDYLTSRSDSGA